MVSLSNSLILITVVIIAIALAGCTASTGSSGNNTTSSQMVVSTVNTGPVETPQATPVPTPTVTATPTPTPVPPPISINGNVNIAGTVDSGNPEYAYRHDTAKFTIENTGGATLQKLVIVYEVDYNETAVSDSGTSLSEISLYTNTSIGTFNTGQSKDLTVAAPEYPAMVNSTVTITAVWQGGSLILYNTILYPNLSGGISPADAAALEEYGSANNP